VVPVAVIGTCATAAPVAINRETPMAASRRVILFGEGDWKDVDMLKLLGF